PFARRRQPRPPPARGHGPQPATPAVRVGRDAAGRREHPLHGPRGPHARGARGVLREPAPARREPVSRARTLRAAALAAVLAALGLAGLTALAWREIAGRYWLAQARRARDV